MLDAKNTTPKKVKDAGPELMKILGIEKNAMVSSMNIDMKAQGLVIVHVDFVLTKQQWDMIGKGDVDA